jgi:hypothetical protein
MLGERILVGFGPIPALPALPAVVDGLQTMLPVSNFTWCIILPVSKFNLPRTPKNHQKTGGFWGVYQLIINRERPHL